MGAFGQDPPEKTRVVLSYNHFLDQHNILITNSLATPSRWRKREKGRGGMDLEEGPCPHITWCVERALWHIWSSTK